MLGVIIGCEVAFWVLILAGLACRYLLKWKKTGSALLLLTPVVDVVLLAVTVAHLRQGAEATFAHGLSAVYIGVSIAFGHGMVRWADERFAHRFAGGRRRRPSRDSDASMRGRNASAGSSICWLGRSAVSAWPA